MDKDHSPLSADGIIDHGVDNIKVHFEIPVGKSLSLSPEHIARAAGVADADLTHLTGVTIDTMSTTTPSSAGLVICHGTETSAKIGERTLSVKAGSSKIESVHAVVHPDATFTPQKLTFHESTKPGPSVIKTAVARVARWKNADAENLKHDVETLTQGGVDRHLIPANVGADSSPIATLFNRNSSNPNFLDGKYSLENRKIVNDKIVVTSADLAKAEASMKENLTTKAPIKNGLTFKVVGLHGDQSSGVVTGQATLHRTPLHADHFNEPTEIPTATCMSVGDALVCMGEEASSAPIVGLGGSNTEASAVFALDLND